MSIFVIAFLALYSLYYGFDQLGKKNYLGLATGLLGFLTGIFVIGVRAFFHAL